MTPDWLDAVTRGDVRCLAELVAAGADVDAKDRYGQTALMLAALRGHDEVAELLLSHGADLDHHAKYHLTALMLAALNGRTAIARMLVAAGADTGAVGSGAPGFADKTALDLAEHHGHDEIAELLRSRRRL